MILKATTFGSIYCVPGTTLETWHEIVSNPRDKVGSVVFILRIYKTKQKPRLSKFAKLVQGHTDRK